MGEGRTPGAVGAGGGTVGTGAVDDASSPAGGRESAILRFRNAIGIVLSVEFATAQNCWRGLIDKDVHPTSCPLHFAAFNGGTLFCLFQDNEEYEHKYIYPALSMYAL